VLKNVLASTRAEAMKFKAAKAKAASIINLHKNK